MNTRTFSFIGKQRLRDIHELYYKIQATYEEIVPLSVVAEITSIPPSNLRKWLRNEAEPREFSFQTAKSAMERVLKVRSPTSATKPEKPVTQRLRPSQYYSSPTRSLATLIEKPEVPVKDSTNCYLVAALCGLAGGSIGAVLIALIL